MKKIIIIEDQNLVREILENEIKASNEIDVVASSDNADNMVSLYEKYSPDLILSDIYTKNNASGLENAKLLKNKYPDSKIILMTGVLEVNLLSQAKEIGVESFIYKNCSANELISVILQTLHSYSIYPNMNDNKSKISLLKDLTSKELSILTLFCSGYDREEICSLLAISSGTLKNRISSILTKTNFMNIHKLSIYCISNQLIIPKTTD